jgi:hypothetical protein
VNALRRVARVVAAIGLAVDAYVHWHLAPGYDQIVGHGSPHLSQGQLFRVEAALALVGLLLVLLVPRRWAAAAAFVIAGGGVAAVLVYRYLDLGAFGPVPNMYEPFWYTEKTVSLIAEAVAAVAAVVCVRLAVPRPAAAGERLRQR